MSVNQRSSRQILLQDMHFAKRKATNNEATISNFCQYGSSCTWQSRHAKRYYLGFYLSCFRKALISQQKKRALKSLLIVVLFIRLAFRKNGRKVADGKRTQDHRSSAHEKSWTDRVKNLLRGLKDLLNICYKIP